jgi:hypothetical protein
MKCRSGQLPAMTLPVFDPGRRALLRLAGLSFLPARKKGKAMGGFSNPLVGGGGSLVYPSIHSPNFNQATQTGWSIDKNGNAFFFGIVTSGAFMGTNFEINQFGAFFYAPTAAFGNLLISLANTTGIDQYGNAYVEGPANYSGGGAAWFAVSLLLGGVQYYTATSAAGPWTQGASITTDSNAGLHLRGQSIQAGIAGSSVQAYLYAPSGDATGATDGLAIATALTDFGCVSLIPGGTYYVNAPLAVPAGTILQSAGGYRTAEGAIIKGVGLVSGAILEPASGTPACTLRGLVIDGAGLAGAIDGIGCYSNCDQGTIEDCTVRNMPGSGISLVNGGGGNPDGWYIHKVSCHNNAGAGIYWDYAVDGQLDTFHLDHNLNGLELGSMNNFSATNGRCQQNTDYGITSDGAFIKATNTFTAVGTENNGKNGTDFTGTNGQGTIVWQGCWSRDDGTSGVSGSGYCGWNLGGLGNDLTKILIGCMSYVTTAANGPDYGIQLANDKGWLIIDGCKFVGSVAGDNDNGGNTVAQQAVSNMLSCIGQEGALAALVLKNAWP